MIDHIKWERNYNSENAIVHKSRLLKRSHATLKTIALKKMTDVSFISAEFGDYPKVFEQQLWVIIEKEMSMEFFSIYTPAFPLENMPDEPVLCLRKGKWNRENHNKQFQKNSHYDKYVLSDNQICMDNIFLSHQESIIFSSLADKIINYAKSGLNFNLTENPEHSWHDIYLGIFDGGFELKVTYSPLIQQDTILEEMILQLKQYFVSFNYKKELVPTIKTHQLSYEQSLMELLSIYK